jgi:hypothetical protein
MNPLSGESQEARLGDSQEFISVHRWRRRQHGVNSPPAAAPSIYKGETLVRVAVLYNRRRCFRRVSRRKVNEYADP